MQIVLSFILFIIGFILLILGANFLVNGASSLAKRLSISGIVIGLTVVAFGTSTPELIVNIFGSLGGYNEIVYGNIIGSNIFNILVILGISGLIYPLTVEKNTVWKEIPFSLLAAILLFILVNDILILGLKRDELSRIDGLLFIGLFLVFIYYTFRISKIQTSDTYEVKTYEIPTTVLYIVGGFILLFIGGKLVIDNTVILASELGVSRKLIALTIIAGGTSLPELATSAVAAFKKRCDIAVGNIIGSNIFNIFLILGISSIINPASYNPILNIDLFVLIFCTLFLFITMFTGTVRKLDRWKALLFIITYFIYIIYLLFRK